MGAEALAHPRVDEGPDGREAPLVVLREEVDERGVPLAAVKPRVERGFWELERSFLNATGRWQPEGPGGSARRRQADRH